MKIAPPALLLAVLLAPAVHAAPNLSLSAVLECGMPADKALAQLKAAGVPTNGSPANVASATAYGVPVKRILAADSPDWLEVTFIIDRSGHAQLAKGAGLKEVQDEEAPVFRRALLAGKNELNVTHPDDPNAEDDEVTAYCRMSHKGAL